jgi:N-acetylglutamate synthase-like GNAT family acetyltransferase
MNILNKDENIKIVETENYEEILTFAIDNGVEYDEENRRYINKPYLGFELLLNNKLIGAVSICKSDLGDYTLEYLAINENYRNKGYATMLIEFIFAKMKKLNINKIYLFAHIYKLYEKTGFIFTKDKEYLITNNCLNCQLFKSKECIPRVMVKEI